VRASPRVTTGQNRWRRLRGFPRPSGVGEEDQRHPRVEWDGRQAPRGDQLHAVGRVDAGSGQERVHAACLDHAPLTHPAGAVVVVSVAGANSVSTHMSACSVSSSSQRLKPEFATWLRSRSGTKRASEVSSSL